MGLIPTAGGGSGGGGAFNADCLNAFLAAALSRVMRATVLIPSVTAASVLHSATVGGFVTGDVGPLQTFGEVNSCELGVFQFYCFLLLLLRLILNKHS